MSQGQERWDVVLRFTSGPMLMQGDVVCRGPVVRIGANPGPGGLRLEGYRALDDRQAVITAYDGGTVSIAPVGQNQVRMGPHEHTEWHDVPPIRGPKYLSPGEAFHLGPPDRGATCIFVESRRLGVWAQNRILSQAADQDPEVQPTMVGELDTARGVPAWFIMGMVSAALITTAGVLAAVLYPLLTEEKSGIGPVVEGVDRIEFVATTEEIEPELLEGLAQPFKDFVMVPNGEAAEWKQLADTQSRWDGKLLEYVTRSAKMHGMGRRFWMRLEQIKDDYEYVTLEMRRAGLPEVFAAIPYWESGYRSDNQSYLCAQGYWQLMPEVAHRMEVEVKGCKLTGTKEPWSPVAVVPAMNVKRKAPYVDYNPETGDASCRIRGCAIDERKDLAISTRAAVELLGEAYEDPVLSASGAAVQLTILSHHAGYDDSRYYEGRVKRVNILPAYKRHLARSGQPQAPDFYGANILCPTNQSDDWCGSVMDPHSQHYAYNIIAEHILAVCYYASNYGDLPAFEPWKPYTYGDGYCKRIDVPQAKQVNKWLGQ